MANAYVGEIRMFAGTFAPAGWALCDGALLPIDQNPTLFNLIGTTYGGDGVNNFALPNLSSRVPVHVGPGFSQGQSAGVEQVTLMTSQIPSHTHLPQANSTNAGNQPSPSGGIWAGSGILNSYSAAGPSVALAPGAIANAGGGQPHYNMIPYLAINFIISMFGIYPSQ